MSSSQRSRDSQKPSRSGRDSSNKQEFVLDNYDSKSIQNISSAPRNDDERDLKEAFKWRENWQTNGIKIKSYEKRNGEYKVKGIHSASIKVTKTKVRKVKGADGTYKDEEYKKDEEQSCGIIIKSTKLGAAESKVLGKKLYDFASGLEKSANEGHFILNSRTDNWLEWANKNDD